MHGQQNIKKWRKELLLKNEALFTDLCRYVDKVKCNWFIQLEVLKIICAFNGEETTTVTGDRPGLGGR